MVSVAQTETHPLYATKELHLPQGKCVVCVTSRKSSQTSSGLGVFLPFPPPSLLSGMWIQWLSFSSHLGQCVWRSQFRPLAGGWINKDSWPTSKFLLLQRGDNLLWCLSCCYFGIFHYTVWLETDLWVILDGCYQQRQLLLQLLQVLWGTRGLLFCHPDTHSSLFRD